MLIKSVHFRHLIGRQQSRPEFQAKLTGNGCRGARVIARQDHALNAELLQVLNCPERIRAQGVAQRQRAQQLLVAHQRHHGLALRFLLFHCGVRGGVQYPCGEFIRRAEQVGFTFNPRFNANTRQRALIIGNGQRNALAFGLFDNRQR